MKKLLFNLVLTFTFSASLAQNFNWVIKEAGSAANSVVVDNNGNIYLTGHFQGIIDFDPGPGTFTLSATGDQGFVQKLDSSGNFIWAKKFGYGANTISNALCLDNIGNIYITGRSETSWNLDHFILKLNNSGDTLWHKVMNGSNSIGYSIAVDSLKNVYITGCFDGVVNFSPGTVPPYDLSSNGNYDVFVQKLDSLGTFIWAKKFGSGGNDIGECITIDKDQNVLITGSFDGSVDFNPAVGTSNVFNINSKGYMDVFVEKLNSVGNFVWAKALGGTGNDSGSSITTDDNNNVYFTGYTIGSVDFDPGPSTYSITSNGMSDIFIEKLSPLGTLLWAKTEGGILSDYGGDIIEDNFKNIYILGVSESPSVDFDPGPGIYTVTNTPIASSYKSMFIQKFDTLGNFTWVTNIEKPSGNSMAVSNTKNITVVGLFADTTDFNNGIGNAVLNNDGFNDIFILNLNQGNCSNMTLAVDSFSNIRCLSSGKISVHASNAQSPYQYTWLETPIVSDSTRVLTTPGIYTLVVTDANNCDRAVSFLINDVSSPLGIDLNTNLVAANFIKDATSIITIDAFNDGCTPVVGELKLILDTILVYIGSTPVPSSISGDTITWNFSNLIFDSLHLTPKVFVTTSPLANLNDTLFLKTTITPFVGDSDTSNNIKDYQFLVVSSFDPNDKAVYPIGKCDDHYILNNQLMTYTVRFQNTGNSPAINVAVLDTLDVDLNLSSVRIVGYSHNMYTEVLNENILKFHFPNINLPDSSANEILSHGYVIFEVMPNSNLTNYTKIENIAGIYFDYNAPIFTNKVTNTIIDVIPSSCSLTNRIPENETNNAILFPNPTNETITILFKNLESGINVEISNLFGQVIQKINKTNVQLIELNIKEQAGIYFIKTINKEGAQQVFKVIKN